MKIKVAVAQYVIPEAVEESLAKLESMAQEAKSRGADLIVAPECGLGYWAQLREHDRDFLPDLQSIAKRNSIAISTTFYRKDHSEYFNQGFVVSKTGEVLHSHKKIYIATPEEEENLSCGKDISVVDSYLGRLGMLICKDAFVTHSHYFYEKFFEWETELLCIPMWSLKWEIFTEEQRKAYIVYAAFRSRAFVVMSSNLNPETGSFGRSMIISPIYGVLQEASADKEELLVQEIDLDEVKQARAYDAWWQPKKKLY
jgi:predicted amidohydrolase